jgi:hypothetical protein
MTKIAIAPNAAGTGLFTIEAPNSNSNRTLTLPDAAGEIYGQGNIVGTVSQSAGVPTGAIIERGSNANGDFVKYADGTMICWSSVLSQQNTANTQSGNWWRQTTFDTWTYPVGFNIAPMGCARSGNVARMFNVTNTGTSSLLVGKLGGDNDTTARDYQVIAVGRWF